LHILSFVLNISIQCIPTFYSKHIQLLDLIFEYFKKDMLSNTLGNMVVARKGFIHFGLIIYKKINI